MAQIIAVPCGADTDAALTALRDRLRARGLRIAGVLQDRAPAPGRARQHMVLHDAAGGFSRVISQDLGDGAGGCRLDPGALEDIVQQVATGLPGADVLFINRFGKQEELGRGFAPLIAEALGADMTVIIAVADEKRAAFEGFAGGLARWSVPGAIQIDRA